MSGKDFSLREKRSNFMVEEQNNNKKTKIVRDSGGEGSRKNNFAMKLT